MGFASLPNWLLQKLIIYARSHFSTILVENLFNHVRTVASCNRKKACSPAAAWHACAIGGSLLDDFDRKSIEVTATARATAAPKLRHGVFSGDAHETTLDAASLGDLTLEAPKIAWPSLQPAALSLHGLQWACAVACDGDWARMSRAWLSLMVSPGTVVLKRDSNRCRLVLRSSHHGVVLWRTPLIGKKLGVAPSARESVCFDVIDKPADWRIADVRFVAPGQDATLEYSKSITTLLDGPPPC